MSVSCCLLVSPLKQLLTSLAISAKVGCMGDLAILRSYTFHEKGQLQSANIWAMPLTMERQSKLRPCHHHVAGAGRLTNASRSLAPLEETVRNWIWEGDEKVGLGEGAGMSLWKGRAAGHQPMGNQGFISLTAHRITGLKRKREEIFSAISL